MILKISFREEKSALWVNCTSYRVKGDLLTIEKDGHICNIVPMEVVKYITVEYEEEVK